MYNLGKRTVLYLIYEIVLMVLSECKTEKADQPA